MWRASVIGLAIWAAGTVGIRLEGHRLLQPGRTGLTGILYLVSFMLMVLFVPWICRLLRLEKESRFKAVTLLILPTLILDPFSCIFFTSLFPNLDPGAAGAFGGWMLVCCGGGVVGVWVKP